VDCDVIQADGGTRTAAITGGYLALAVGLKKLIQQGDLPETILRPPVAAISVGLIAGQPVLDLSYTEDVQADVDLNIAMNQDDQFIEIQGTAEGEPYSKDSLEQMLSLAADGIRDLFHVQEEFFKQVS
jgi:ribonuclease PH